MKGLGGDEITLDLKETDKDAGVALRTGAPFSVRDMDEEWKSHFETNQTMNA